MQEEVENRTINLAISTTRLTARSVIAGIRKYLQHREKVKARKGIRDTAVHGKQSVKQLLGQNQGATNVEIDKDGILSLCELIMGSKDGLQPIEKTVIDRCVHQIYQRYFDNPVPENMPVLEDLYNALLKQDEKEAHHVATALEIYINKQEFIEI